MITRAFMRLLRTPLLFSAAKTVKDAWFFHTRKGREYRTKSRDLYSRFLTKDSLCFDVGANVGNKTRLFREIGARVVCIEPQRQCVRALERFFGKDDHVTIVHAAVGDRMGEGEVAICVDSPELSSMSGRWMAEGPFSLAKKWTRKERVSVVTMDWLIQRHGMPAFCKIDVEGYEVSVLKGLTVPVPALSFEFQSEYLPAAAEAMALLARLGPVAFNFSVAETMELSLPSWAPQEEVLAAIASDGQKGRCGDIYARFA